MFAHADKESRLIKHLNAPFLKQLLLVAVVVVTLPVSAEDKGDRELQKRIQDAHAENADHWIYNDIAAGFKKAKQTGKPLFVTFRCVPCKDCMGFDGEVASGSERVKLLAAEKFVCVRQVEMKGVDLSLFQFDHDLNWAGMFLNADGTIYARYGTQSEKGADEYNSVEGLINTMNRVLKLHAGYPRNGATLKGKRAAKKPWGTAMDMKTLQPNLRKGGQTTRSNCIHCHNIHDAEHDYWIEQDGKLSHDRLWRYPLPENIGLMVDKTNGRSVVAVAKDSPSESAGLQTGDEIDLINGQAVSSIADIQWVLHHVPNSNNQQVVLTLASGDDVAVKLNRGWKETDISWRGSIYSISPRLRVWMPPLNSFQRKDAGLKDNENALLVKWINRGSLAGKAAAKAGLKQGDILLKVDGKEVPSLPQKLNAWIKLNYQVGDTLEMLVLRNGREQTVRVPLVE